MTLHNNLIYSSVLQNNLNEPVILPEVLHSRRRRRRRQRVAKSSRPDKLENSDPKIRLRRYDFRFRQPEVQS